MADWQNCLTDHFERQEARTALLDEADKVSPCDGQDPGSVKQFLRELELLALEHRVLVFDKRARGSMLRTGMRWIQGHQDNPDWMAFKTHLLNSFVSADANNARRIDLQRCTRQPGESLLSYNRRFSELAFAASRPQQQRQEHTDVEKEVQILKTQYGKLEAKLDRLLEFNIRNPTERSIGFKRTLYEKDRFQ
ncbi:hypothetical protein CAPTEDRAFT_199676 [Capitella teleta]|uniref:Retrotransposon gag domain-containing protein n=1 Tax=Capitella teleta TaxID=283909 RepID=R7U9N4_CAPTE|nr:hypothetical protein CAPTEDRAFT_199676 [Capitella teleta]|eukprot:ELU02704.1 hypothetical protein CAPTEDRAFT_199676 [Capitella teleta]